MKVENQPRGTVKQNQGRMPRTPIGVVGATAGRGNEVSRNNCGVNKKKNGVKTGFLRTGKWLN
jgi:hypothetical protein